MGPDTTTTHGTRHLEGERLTAGWTITAVGDSAVSSSTDLTPALATRDPGNRVSVAWTDASGTDHAATVTLGSGPAD
ncbi:MAG: hypothetical protein ABIO48_02115 [Pedococcus sp.]